MDYNEVAIMTMEAATDNDVSIGDRPYFHNKAQAWAAIAQAEQLKRIADAMEWRNQLLEKEAKLFDLIAHSDE